MVITNAEAPETVLSRTLSARSAKLERETQVGGAGGALRQAHGRERPHSPVGSPHRRTR